MTKHLSSDDSARPDNLLSSGGMIVREKKPVNLEMPFGSLDDFITPVERFYVRCHHPIPEIDAEAWRLKIEGDVENPLELSYAELAEMETRAITVTMECADNGRAFLELERPARSGKAALSAMRSGPVSRWPPCWREREFKTPRAK